MNVYIIFGIALLVAGIAVLTVTQVLLHRWIKRYNKEWMEDTNEMS